VTIPKICKVSNYPNPFNPETTINFQTNQNSWITVTIYNIKGEKITTLHNGYLNAGKHELIWNVKNNEEREVTSGIYFYRIDTQQDSFTQKMILLK
jgi:flagellar hook assembly protein FlgD